MALKFPDEDIETEELTVPMKLIIDADPGIGDAVAITLAILDPDVELLAVTSAAGCVSGRQASLNVQAIIDYLDPVRRPRVGVCHEETATAELTFGGADIRWSRIHGPRGLGKWDPQVAELHNARETPKLLCELVKEYPNEITLLTLGPLSNVAQAIERNREFLDGLRALVCFGGSVRVGGNVTAAAEFNMYIDPLAARKVLKSLATKTLVPLDVCHDFTLTVPQHERLMHSASPQVRELFEHLLPHAIRANHELFGIEGVSLNEVIALVTAVRPDLVEREPMSINVETTGELTRGMTVFDRRGLRQWQSNIDVATHVNSQEIFDYVSRISALS